MLVFVHEAADLVEIQREGQRALDLASAASRAGKPQGSPRFQPGCAAAKPDRRLETAWKTNVGRCRQGGTPGRQLSLTQRAGRGKPLGGRVINSAASRARSSVG
jgi:hypothetical protein